MPTAMTAAHDRKWIGRDSALARARNAITERPVAVEPGATAGDALIAHSQAGTSHLLVSGRSDATPEGVVFELDVVPLEGA